MFNGVQNNKCAYPIPFLFVKKKLLKAQIEQRTETLVAVCNLIAMQREVAICQALSSPRTKPRVSAELG